MNRYDDSKNNRTSGFTVAQFLILLAILVLIVIISIPVVQRELERSLESTDFSTARTVYAEFMADILGGDEGAVINDIPIKQSDDTYRVEIYPLSQRIDGWTIRIDNKEIGGIPSAEWIGTPRRYGACIISYFPDTGRTTIHWGTGFPLMSLGQLHKISDSVRVEEDQRQLRELGEQIFKQYWTVDKLRKKLELPADDDDAKAGNASDDTDDTADASADSTSEDIPDAPIKIAEYCQLKQDVNTGDGFRIISTRGFTLEELLRAAGYEPGTTQFKAKKGKGKKTTTYQYSLFFSDELAANHFGGYSSEPAKRAIYIDDIQTNKDVISGFTIYTQAMDGQAELTKEQEDQFRITIN